MTTYHTYATSAACADPRVLKALGPCTCDEAWTTRGMCTPDCAVCQHGEDVLAEIKQERRTALGEACDAMCPKCQKAPEVRGLWGKP